MPPLEALPAPVEEEGLEEGRPELDFIHFIAPPRSRVLPFVFAFDVLIETSEGAFQRVQF